jgi:hypothetical protein
MGIPYHIERPRTLAGSAFRAWPALAISRGRCLVPANDSKRAVIGELT